MAKARSTEDVLAKISQHWEIQEYSTLTAISIISVKCLQCQAIIQKEVRKLLEAHKNGKSGCMICFAKYSKSPEYAAEMGKRSAPKGSRSRTKQSIALKSYFESLTAEQRSEIYGNADQWTDAKRQTQSEKLKATFANMTPEEKAFKVGTANRNPDKIAKQKQTIKKKWKETRVKRAASGTLKLLDGDIGLSQYATDRAVPLPWVHRVYNLLGPDMAKKYIDEYQGHTTDIEQIIESLLGVKKFNKKVFGKYKPDFKINDRLFVNTDGLWWHKEETVGQNYHYEMRAFFEQQNCRIVQFYAPELYHKLPIVKSIINNLSGKSSNKIHARKCLIVRVDKPQMDKFLNDNHMMGTLSGTTAFALTYKDTIVSMMTVSRDGDGIEIDRFCNKLDTSVAGGFSKLLAHIQGIYVPQFIKSWVDLRYGNGHSLEKLGFIKAKDVLSWKWSNGNKLFSRTHCMANMDERGLTQDEHAKEMKLYKIFDAGQRLYTKIIKP